MVPPSKRRRIESKVEEITFDDAARHEYLTGFHKRKVQRAREAQEAAQKKARAEKLEDRKKLREERKAELERHVQETNAFFAENLSNGDDVSDDEGSEQDWHGLDSPEPEPIDHEAEYIDEDKYTTVTVEAIDVTREGLSKSMDSQDEPSSHDKEDHQPVKQAGQNWKLNQDKRKRTKENPQKKRKKFRYESKTERKLERTKQRLKNSKQARARRND